MALHKLMEDGLQVGGALTEMQIGAANGSLSEISVAPATDEDREINEEAWVSLQVADRVAWLGPDDVRALVLLLQLGHGFMLRKTQQ